MANKKIFAEILAVMLVFGLVFVSCENGPKDDDTITEVSKNSAEPESPGEEVDNGNVVRFVPVISLRSNAEQRPAVAKTEELLNRRDLTVEGKTVISLLYNECKGADLWNIFGIGKGKKLVESINDAIDKYNSGRYRVQ